MRKIQLSWGNFYDNNSLTKHDSSQPCQPVLQNNKNSYILKNFKSHTSDGVLFLYSGRLQIN